MWHSWERQENYRRFWRKSPKERDHWENGGVVGRMGLELIFARLVGEVWSIFRWLRIGTGGELL
jgi:hypothetical protein